MLNYSTFTGHPDDNDEPPALPRLEQAFEKFNADNPRVFVLLVAFARMWRQKRTGPCSIAMLFERVRWEVALETESADPFKMSNNHRAYYARKIMDENPDLVGIFNLRSVSQ